MAKKDEKIEVVDGRGNVARPYRSTLDKWIAAGWKPAVVAKVQADDDQEAPNVMTKEK